MWSRDLIDEELDALVQAFQGVAKASYQRNMSIISLICNIDRTSEILEKVCPANSCHCPCSASRQVTWS